MCTAGWSEWEQGSFVVNDWDSTGVPFLLLPFDVWIISFTPYCASSLSFIDEYVIVEWHYENK